MCVCVCVCACVCVYLNSQIHTYVHTLHAYIYSLHTHILFYICTLNFTHVHVHGITLMHSARRGEHAYKTTVSVCLSVWTRSEEDMRLIIAGLLTCGWSFKMLAHIIKVHVFTYEGSCVCVCVCVYVCLYVHTTLNSSLYSMILIQHSPPCLAH